MERFKEGQKATHKLYGYVVVTDVDDRVSLVEVRDSDGKYHQVHPISLIKLPIPKFEVRIEWAGGTVTLSGPLYQDAVSAYIDKLTDHLYRADKIEVNRLRPPVTKNA